MAVLAVPQVAQAATVYYSIAYPAVQYEVRSSAVTTVAGGEGSLGSAWFTFHIQTIVPGVGIYAASNGTGGANLTHLGLANSQSRFFWSYGVPTGTGTAGMTCARYS